MSRHDPGLPHHRPAVIDPIRSPRSKIDDPRIVPIEKSSPIPVACHPTLVVDGLPITVRERASDVLKTNSIRIAKCMRLPFLTVISG